MDKVYDRAEILRYLGEAECERVRLEAALVVAQERRRIAELELRAAAEESLRATASLRSATRDLATERDTTERTVAVILEVAETEAQTILAEAREVADGIVARVLAAGRSDGAAVVEVLTHPGASTHRTADGSGDRWNGLQLVG